ncbi:hypothetical protein H4S06_004080 [Coemansia sp. BCRC 34490]|nr:hypothetical protein LPJ72_004555 [Coemansia sp. Benny D160-2]KAJ2751731.1 hypothetical protein H4S06_004080 [Coemansia sp. BCRC 34490]
MSNVHRPTFIGIHSRDASTQILYISSGCRQTMGFTPAYMVSRRAHEFIADPYHSDYPSIYESKEEAEEADEDEANAYVMYMNIKTAQGPPVLHRVTTFKCDNCVIVVAMAFPELPYQNRHELEVQMLDGAMKRMNITREKEAERANNHRQAAALWRMRSEAQQGQRVPLYYARTRQIKVAFVLESPASAPDPAPAAAHMTAAAAAAAGDAAAAAAARRQNGPLVVFVTGSIGRLIDADTSDLLRYPFLKLVAPEDLLRVSKFFEKLADTPDVLFETFSLLQRPHVIDGDIVVADEDNSRVVVECLGANVQDGVALLLRKLRSQPPPTADGLANYMRPKVHEMDEDGGYMTLSEMISDDPETSDAPEWSRLR